MSAKKVFLLSEAYGFKKNFPVRFTDLNKKPLVFVSQKKFSFSVRFTDLNKNLWFLSDKKVFLFGEVYGFKKTTGEK